MQRQYNSDTNVHFQVYITELLDFVLHFCLRVGPAQTKQRSFNGNASSQMFYVYSFMQEQ